MANIKDILILDLQEDIKKVIDLEDQSDDEILTEISSYILTEGLSRHLSDFISQYKSNKKETGVWISGFYGSGKSYFGKMLGYILSNPVVSGTHARERFILRLKGLSNETLLENEIRGLDSIQSRVILLDIAKQNTDKGLAFTLFANFLKNLGFRNDIYGFIEFDLFLDGKYDDFKRKVLELEGDDWSVIKLSNMRSPSVMKKVLNAMGTDETLYNQTIELYKNAIALFSAGSLKEQLSKYLAKCTGENIVFIFDEASEAISQKKFNLLDLEGLTEALSAMDRKVWTIAIAQEKLDDVINNNNLTKSQLVKLTDRFRQFGLEATEVDVIIRNRLLKKKDEYIAKLKEYYTQHDGLISDVTNLNAVELTKTTTADDFAIYYPFHKYHFKMLQNFLFSSNSLVATQVAARGMIITIFDVLRKQVKDKSLYQFSTGYELCSEAQIAPPTSLTSKYARAKDIVNDKVSGIDGEKLLKTINIIDDSGIFSPTVENITKGYISDMDGYYEAKIIIEKALELLVESKVLLLSNNMYKITSDLETRLLDEMNDFTVEVYNKKRLFINYLKDYKLFMPVSSFSDAGENYKFQVSSDMDDDIITGNKFLKMRVCSIYTMGDSMSGYIEQVKTDTQYLKDTLTIVPDNSIFSKADKLITEITRYGYMEEKYGSDADQEKRKIIRDFASIKDEKSKELRMTIESAYTSGTLIYMYDEFKMNSDTFRNVIVENQRKIVKNVYTKRLSQQLSETVIPRIFSSKKEDLARLFSGSDFTFFDASGNFIGDHLKVVEEISTKIQSRLLEGRTLEEELSSPPWGYSFGTIVTTLAVLYRAGKLSIKHNGHQYFSHENKESHEAFINSTRFKSAAFKSITASLTASDKNKAVQVLIDLGIGEHINKKIDWNINDYDLADLIRLSSEYFIGAYDSLVDSVNDFEKLFPNVYSAKNQLREFNGAVTENNYIEKVENFLKSKDLFSGAIESITNTQKFIKKNFDKVRNLKRFCEEVKTELSKAEKSESGIVEAHDEFMRLYTSDMVSNYSELQQKAQDIKDTYYTLMVNASKGMNNEYNRILEKIKLLKKDINSNYPLDINTAHIRQLDSLEKYCVDRVLAAPQIEYSKSCKKSGYSLSDIINYTAIAQNKESELFIIQSSLVKQAPVTTPVTAEKEVVRQIKVKLPVKKMSVREYRTFLTSQLSNISAAKPDDEIEFDLEGVK